MQPFVFLVLWKAFSVALHSPAGLGLWAKLSLTVTPWLGCRHLCFSARVTALLLGKYQFMKVLGIALSYCIFNPFPHYFVLYSNVDLCPLLQYFTVIATKLWWRCLIYKGNLQSVLNGNHFLHSTVWVKWNAKQLQFNKSSCCLMTTIKRPKKRPLRTSWNHAT